MKKVVGTSLKQYCQESHDSVKKSLRKVFRQLRDHKIIENKEEKLESIKSKLSELIYQRCLLESSNSDEVLISCYYPIKNEVDALTITLNIIPSLQEKLNRKFILCLPKTFENERVLKFFEYRKEKEEEILIKGKFGLKEPDITKCKELIPNIIITPLLAFDENKNRLGYGKGYYDNTFYHFKREGHKFTSIGLAYDEQLYSDNLPIGEYDQPLDFIITPMILI